MKRKWALARLAPTTSPSSTAYRHHLPTVLIIISPALGVEHPLRRFETQVSTITTTKKPKKENNVERVSPLSQDIFEDNNKGILKEAHSLLAKNKNPTLEELTKIAQRIRSDILSIPTTRPSERKDEIFTICKAMQDRTKESLLKKNSRMSLVEAWDLQQQLLDIFIRLDKVDDAVQGLRSFLQDTGQDHRHIGNKSAAALVRTVWNKLLTALKQKKKKNEEGKESIHIINTTIISVYKMLREHGFTPDAYTLTLVLR